MRTLVKTSPQAPSSFVETPDGAGTVSSSEPAAARRCRCGLDSAPESPKCYRQTASCCVIRNGKGQAARGLCGAPPLEELAKLRKPQEPEERPPT